MTTVFQLPDLSTPGHSYVGIGLIHASDESHMGCGVRGIYPCLTNEGR